MYSFKSFGKRSVNVPSFYNTHEFKKFKVSPDSLIKTIKSNIVS